MNRLVLGIVGVLLPAAPAGLLFNTMMPVPQYRTGTFADYAGAARACVALYGGAVGGLFLQILWSTARRQAISGRQVFRACLVGAIGAIGIAIAVAGPGTLGGWS